MVLEMFCQKRLKDQDGAAYVVAGVTVVKK